MPEPIYDYGGSALNCAVYQTRAEGAATDCSLEWNIVVEIIDE
ncbi:hypothetical protein ABIF97_006832 [Bradyrhizobium japonicum]